MGEGAVESVSGFERLEAGLSGPATSVWKARPPQRRSGAQPHAEVSLSPAGQHPCRCRHRSDCCHATIQVNWLDDFQVPIYLIKGRTLGALGAKNNESKL